MSKVLHNLISFLILIGLTACGFHLKNISIPVDFSKISPLYEQKKFISMAPSIGFYNQKNAQIVFENLAIKPNLLSEENTGNQWRQYRYEAQWQITDRTNHKTYLVKAEEQLNLPSNQSPYQTQLVSSQLDGLRYKLLQASQLEITKQHLGSFASAPKKTT